jgi:hypothetical protein
MKPFFSFHKLSSILLLLVSLIISITLGAWNVGSLVGLPPMNVVQTDSNLG